MANGTLLASLAFFQSLVEPPPSRTITFTACALPRKIKSILSYRTNQSSTTMNYFLKFTLSFDLSRSYFSFSFLFLKGKASLKMEKRITDLILLAVSLSLLFLLPSIWIDTRSVLWFACVRASLCCCVCLVNWSLCRLSQWLANSRPDWIDQVKTLSDTLTLPVLKKKRGQPLLSSLTWRSFYQPTFHFQFVTHQGSLFIFYIIIGDWSRTSVWIIFVRRGHHKRSHPVGHHSSIFFERLHLIRC